VLHLEAVEPRHRAAFEEMAREFRGHGDERFASVLEDWDAYLAATQRSRLGLDLPADRVQQTSFLAFSGSQLVGCVRLRHRRIEVLERDGGNIGYEVRPCARRQGYGRTILARVLEEAERIGLQRVLLTADTENLASIRIIEGAGGIRTGNSVSHHSFRAMARYHIELPRLTERRPEA